MLGIMRVSFEKSVLYHYSLYSMYSRWRCVCIVGMPLVYI